MMDAVARGVSLVVVLLLCTPLAPARAADGLGVMQEVRRALLSDGEEMSVRMTVTSPSNSEERTFRMWTKATEDKPARSLIRFESPGNIAGTALLAVQRPNGKQDSWLYVPSLDQVRRVAPADRSESFVGSDFTIEDLTVVLDPETRSYTVLGEAECGGDRTCVQVEDKPTTDAAARASGYGRVVLYVDKELSVTWRIDFYDKAGGLLKVLSAAGLVQVGDRWRFDKATVANVQTGSTTVMTVVSRNEGRVDDSIFSPSALEAW